MKIAFVHFEQMTTLDLVGFYDAVTRLPRYSSMAVSWDFCGVSEEVTDDRGMTIKTPSVEPDLAQYDLVFVPGGFGTRELRHDKKFISWLQTGTDVKHKVSVCTGALLLGAAGFLTHRRATTNSSAYTLLAPYCKEVVTARIVKDGDVITAGGVATSIDLGLYVVELLSDAQTAERVQQSMDYPYYRTGRIGVDYEIESLDGLA